MSSIAHYRLTIAAVTDPEQHPVPWKVPLDVQCV